MRNLPKSWWNLGTCTSTMPLATHRAPTRHQTLDYASFAGMGAIRQTAVLLTAHLLLAYGELGASVMSQKYMLIKKAAN